MHSGALIKLVALKPGLNQHGRGDILVGEEFEASSGSVDDLITRGMAELAKPKTRRRIEAPVAAPPRQPTLDKPDTETTEGGE